MMSLSIPKDCVCGHTWDNDTHVMCKYVGAGIFIPICPKCKRYKPMEDEETA